MAPSASMGERLRSLRILLLHQIGLAGSVDPALLLFPEEFGALQKGLGMLRPSGVPREPLPGDAHPARALLQQRAPGGHALLAFPRAPWG